MKSPGRDAKIHTSVVLKTQTLQVLSRLLTAIAPASEGGGRQRLTAALPLLSARNVEMVFGQLPLLGTVAASDRTLFLDMVHSLSGSSLLEHLAKAAAPRAAAANAAAAVPSATLSSRPSITSGGPRWAFQTVLEGMLIALQPGDRPSLAMRALLSGPCLQYFAAAQAVSQLHAADGGPLYGLPYDALLPPTLEEPAGEPPGNQTAARQRQQRSTLRPTGVAGSVSFWQACLAQDPPAPLGPLRHRHLVALCLRAARVALDSLDVHQGEVGQGQRQEQGARQGQRARATSSIDTGGVGSDSMGGTQRAGGLGRPFHVRGCGGLALDSLEVAATILGGANGGKGPAAGGTSSVRDSGPRVVENASGGGAVRGDGGGSSDTDSHAAPPPAGRPDPRLHHAPTAARWWPLAVRGVRAFVLQCGYPCATTPTRTQHAALSASLIPRYCSLLQLNSRTEVSELESWPKDVHAAPPAGLPHALSAGYIPTYEALLRAACRSAELSLPASSANRSARENVMAAVAARVATRLLRSLLLVAPGSQLLLLLLGEGHPREAAALSTTLCKAHLQHAQLAAWLGNREGLAEAAGMATGLSRVFRTGMTAQIGELPVVPTATSSSSSSSGGGGSGSDSGLNGSSDRVFAVSGQRIYPVDVGSPSKQRLLLLSHMLPRLLPVMTHIGALCFAGGLGGGTAELQELAVARHQLLQCAANGAKVAKHTADCDQAAKGSWLQLLRDAIVADVVSPGGLAAAQRASTGVGGRGGVVHGEPRGNTECTQSGSENEQDEEDGEAEWEGQQQQWVKLVPHAPCVAAQLLRTCSNPLCVTMTGDSEAGVVLGVAEAGSGGRAERPLASALGVGGEATRFCSAACRDSQQEQLRQLSIWEKEDMDCRNCRWCCAMRGEHSRG